MEKCVYCGKEVKYIKSHININHPEKITKNKKNCKNCCKDITDTHPNKNFCCILCRDEYNNKQKIEKSKKIEGDYVECKICGYRNKSSIASHLRYNHQITTKEYRKKYPNSETISKTYKEFQRDKILGEKNPSFNHQGKFSALSKNFHKYKGLSEEEIQQNIDNVVRKISNSLRENGSAISSLTYWLNRGYDNETAKKKQTDRQKTFSLEICIEKYGKEEGQRIWQNRQEKWQSTLNNKPKEEIITNNKKKAVTLEKIKSKYGEEDGQLKWKEIQEKKVETLRNNPNYEDIVAKRINSSKFYSNISQDFCNEIFNRLNEDDKNHCYYATLNKEFTKYNKDDKRCYAYDFVLSRKKIVIEFNGDLVHANPKIFTENEIPKFFNNNKITAKEIWKKDKNKNEFMEKLGFKVYVVWENDYRERKNEVIEEMLCLINS